MPWELERLYSAGKTDVDCVTKPATEQDLQSRKSREKTKNMIDLEVKNYPNVGQSFGIVGILILGSLLVR